MTWGSNVWLQPRHVTRAMIGEKLGVSSKEDDSLPPRALRQGLLTWGLTLSHGSARSVAARDQPPS